MQNVALKIEEPMLLSVLYLGYLVEVPPTYLTPGNHGRGADPVGKGHAGYGGVEWYDQATQDGCCLALCTSPAQPVPASPTPYSPY